MLAEIIVLDHDSFKISPDEISEAGLVSTIFDVQIVCQEK